MYKAQQLCGYITFQSSVSVLIVASVKFIVIFNSYVVSVVHYVLVSFLCLLKIGSSLLFQHYSQILEHTYCSQNNYAHNLSKPRVGMKGAN